ncbi:peptidoglycan DD-metalloendopeptidase family protein [Desulfospira joergensenii]|uniref:peptidoglycan DD-metalloendopeptidase family protein n=1 Tax=Desulfospira joergensenii TaxID=53329 RepID=UPI0003B692D8|nr:peptidoglycan DD-metalloendopeptidase family protein [Desulfospira joergensenii]
MKYPYVAYSDKVEIQPLFKGLAGDPLVVDMSVGSPLFDQVDILNQKAFQAWLDKTMKNRFSWGLASYLEDRETILKHYPQMKEEQRYFHLGLDIIVDLGTPLHAPLDSVVQESAYEEGEGNYGGNVLLRHESPHFETFYSLYGHLNREKLPAPGKIFKAGEPFAWIGDFHENGNWFYHTHLQVITQKGIDQGWLSKGYCSARDLAIMDGICPSPLSLFRV